MANELGASVGALEQYWSGIGRWLQIQADSFNRLIDHQVEKGRANELSVAEFLSGLLPPNLGIGGGMIIGTDDIQSRQCDLIVHELHKHPRLFAQTAQFVYPADTVVMTVEVKTTLDQSEVTKIGKNTASVRSAKRSSQSTYCPLVTVFAFASSASPQTTLKWFEELPIEEQPDLVCVVTPGLVISHKGGTIVGECVLLHVRTGGERQSMTWATPTASGSTALIDGDVYPVADLKVSGVKEGKVFEPGRAMLLFSVAMLAELGNRGQLATSWWDEYLDPTTRETVVLDSTVTDRA